MGQEGDRKGKLLTMQVRSIIEHCLSENAINKLHRVNPMLATKFLLLPYQDFLQI
jgi:hypothetical protein